MSARCAPAADPDAVAREIESACRDSGFFYVAGHGVPAALLDRLDAAARAFFALPEAAKLAIAMRHGGPAWRGYFPVGGELTAGRPDRKEGIYFGEELPDGDPRAGLPLHGRNLFPARGAGAARRGARLPGRADRRWPRTCCAGSRRSLDLPADYFAAGYTRGPTVLFRIFHYPPQPPDADDWGVGEHTDYGLLTLLAQDENGGLAVRTPARLGRRAAGAGHVRLQHRRHARPADRRVVPVDPAPGAQRQRQRAALVPVLLRPGLPRRGAAAARSGAHDRDRRAALGRRGPGARSPAPTATT